MKFTPRYAVRETQVLCQARTRDVADAEDGGGRNDASVLRDGARKHLRQADLARSACRGDGLCCPRAVQQPQREGAALYTHGKRR